MIRLFAAVAVPEETAEALAPAMRGLPGARWRPAEALHVTLRFVGEVREDVANDLDVELGRISQAPFEISLRGVSCFGEGAQVRAVWAAVEESEPLRVLAGRCEAAAKRAGLTPDKRAYRPHVTLAYLKGADPDRVAGWIRAHNLLRPPPFVVERFGLYSSVLHPDGSRYALERAYPLR